MKIEENIYVARMETEIFSWIAFGKTEGAAKRAIVKEWNKSPHREKTTVKELEDYYGINVIQAIPGKCYVE